jgi:hypothetical protein
MRGCRESVLGAALCILGIPAARGQVTATPDSVIVVVLQGQEAAVELSLRNAGATEVVFCSDFNRPLQRRWERGGCQPPGEVMHTFDESDLGDEWIPHGITITPDDRLFLAETVGSRRTFELTADLAYVREFDQPVVLEVGDVQQTIGVTYNDDTSTLWWTNIELSGATVVRVLLLEGTLTGVPTGRRIEIPVPLPSPPGSPMGAAYDASRKRYYYTDGRRDEIWAVDTMGTVIPGYPIRLERYPTGYLGTGADVHPSAGGPWGVRLEVLVGTMLDLQYDRVVVTDTAGADLDAETPLAALVSTQGGPEGITVRSRTDPNGVMYVPYFQNTNHGVAAVRPAPLPPTWLSLSHWSGTIPAGGTSELTLTFTAGQREPGEYRSTLVVEDTAGVVLASVPLTLVVEPATPANEPGAGEAGISLTVSPNPIAGAGAVTVTLARPAAEVRVVVYDVLGREVGTLHAAALPAGATRLDLAAGRLRPGVYAVRAEVAGASLARTFTVRG